MERRLSLLITVLVRVVFSFLFLVIPVKAQIVPLYIVNTTSDTVVANACFAGTAGCSLRGAILEANLGSDSVITIAIPASDPNCTNGVCTINLTQVLPGLARGMSITGPGGGLLTVRPDTGGIFRIFTVTTAGTVFLSGLTISNGVALNLNGGGILNSGSGTLNVTNCVIRGNFANNGYGGGLYNNNGCTMNVTNSTISGNIASGGSGKDGGGISNSGLLNVTNSTLSGNTASAGSGGGINNNIGGIVNVTNSTLSGNSATLSSLGSGGGIGNRGTMQVKNSIIALNTHQSSPDVSGNFTSAGFNLIGKNDGAAASFPTGNPNANNDIVGTVAAPVDPKLDPNGLRDNGGLTPTISLLIDSPAIDQGTSAGLTGNLTTDQRGTGFPRTSDDPATPNAAGGDGTDIGAFEVQTSLVTRLANISTRLSVQTGDNVLIGGFIVTGTQAKRVIVRALGPSLNVGGVPIPGRLGDTTLRLVGPGGPIATNDNWRTGGQEAEIIASTVPPPNDLESAIIATLPANNSAYTAIVEGAGMTSGIGSVETYDLDQAAASELANISTRGFVQTGDNVMIGGFIVVGSGSRRVIVRALGPSLNASGVPIPGRLPNTTLEIANANGTILFMNDDWRSTQEAEIIATTVPPPDNLESAIVATLPAAPYTAIVRGKNGAMGVGQVEVYALTN